MKLRGAVKSPTFALPFVAHTRHAWLARLTRARRGGLEGGRRESSLLTFGILRLGDAVQRWLRHPEPSYWSRKSTINKSFFTPLKSAINRYPPKHKKGREKLGFSRLFNSYNKIKPFLRALRRRYLLRHRGYTPSTACRTAQARGRAWN